MPKPASFDGVGAPGDVFVMEQRGAKVVFGPGTRLGRALLEVAPAETGPTLLVARTDKERGMLAARWPAAKISSREEPDPQGLEGADSLAIHVCALGPVHPAMSAEAADWAGDAAGVASDLDLLARLLRARSGRPVHVVFVSSVLALASGRRRRYYAGWKCLIEATVERMLDGYPRARMSVLYPGRLVESRSAMRPASLLHGRYPDLAARMIAIAASERGSRRLFGPDARLWLMSRGLRSAFAAIRPTLSD